MRMLAVLFCLSFSAYAQVRPGQLATVTTIQTIGASGHLLIHPLPVAEVVPPCDKHLGPCPEPEGDNFNHIALGEKWDLATQSQWAKDFGRWTFRWSIRLTYLPKLLRRQQPAAREAR